MEFHGDAIVLSGTTGTKLKCEILGKYYQRWWNITSGGDSGQHARQTSIIELNAGTGEDYIEEAGETILGSAGHALKLKNDGGATSKLRVVLVEENNECFGHLKGVIRRRWKDIDVSKAEGPKEQNDTGVHLLNKSLEDALVSIEDLDLGNSLFFFDPLLYTPWTEIRRVAKSRLRYYYQSGTEFIVFLFTSDWFTGRAKTGLAPLPPTTVETDWTKEQAQTVSKMDELFGMPFWRNPILTKKPTDLRVDALVESYRNRLHQWFRYVVPLPFMPKRDQLYHLFMCSNYEVGITLTKGFYEGFTKNELYAPDNTAAYERFKRLHAISPVEYPGNRKPLTWKILWATIKNHEEGLCDIRCDDFRKMEPIWENRLSTLGWLEQSDYFRKEDSLTTAWPDQIPMYRLNWDTVAKNLGITPPKALLPLQPSS
ncbi:MAG: three-Cys-motif partner protein TcmP [Nitrososphaerales archaeon]